eukprot:TRINITY_DN47172_c0_g1_i1.p1 TRINITY_DN47172_c0_g1~~TRINITY_DN47172_c0_g1_i1.p1  ORF type:complete len:115 (-),score=28.63 TRINITY_DN47172_c0_g1_i1:347-691(-)
MGAGEGGWPTVRYFNKQTGYGGRPYTKKTNMQMCDELGDQERLQGFVEDKGGASLCDVVFGNGCNEKELKFIIKWWDNGKPGMAEEKARRDQSRDQKDQKASRLLARMLQSEDL